MGSGELPPLFLYSSLACDDIGYTEALQAYIFLIQKILFPLHAMVVPMDMKKSKIGNAPNITAGKEVWETRFIKTPGF